MKVCFSREYQSTQRCLLLALLLQEPLLCLNSMLSLLLLKQLHAAPLHIALLTMALPAVSILSFYWTSILKEHPQWQRSNLILATILAPLFYFFSFFSGRIPYFILASCFFMLFWRGGNPALMEILRAKFSEEERSHLYSNLYKMSFGIEIVLGPLMGCLLDWRPEWWKGLLSCCGLLYAASILFYHKIPGRWQTGVYIPLPEGSLVGKIVTPWIASWDLLKKKRSFRFFQIGFFLGGFGLMISRPSVDILVAGLNISYRELFVCRTVLKALGILAAAKMWSRVLCQQKILFTSFCVLSCFSLFYLLMSMTYTFPSILFFAYFLYGLAQSGSHLVWNLSGTLFSEGESSTPYSSVNVLTVGVRGIIAPLLGACFAKYVGLYPALLLGGALVFLGALYFRKRALEERTQPALAQIPNM